MQTGSDVVRRWALAGAVVGLLLLPLCATSAVPTIALERRVLLGFDELEDVPMALQLDGTASSELALVVRNAHEPVIVTLRFDAVAARLVPIAIIPLEPWIYSNSATSVHRVQARFIAGGRDLLAALVGDEVRIFDGLSSSAMQVYARPPSSFPAAGVADLDLDGDLDLVHLSAGDARAVDLATGSTLWDDPGSGFEDISLAQLDADPQPEVVLDGDGGRILDGADGSLQWEYAGGYGDRIVVGNFDADAQDEFIALHMTHGLLFDAGVPVAELDVSSFDWSAAFDRDGDGRDELWVSRNDGVDVLAMPGGEVVARLPGLAGGLAVAQLDGDAGAEVFAAAADPQRPLQLVDASAGTIQASLPWLALPPRQIAFEDVDADGVADVVALHGYDSYFGPDQPPPVGIWTADGVRKAQWSGAQLWSSAQRVHGMAVAELDGDARREIVLVGEFDNQPAVMARDAGSLALQWGYVSTDEGDAWIDARHVAALPPSGGRSPLAVLLSGYGHSHLRLLDGATGAPQWTSADLGDSPVGVRAGDVDGDGESDATVYSTSALWTYAENGAFAWDIALDAPLFAVDTVLNELLSLSCDGVLSVTDAATRTHLRSADVALASCGGQLLSLGDGDAVLLALDGTTTAINTHTGEAVPGEAIIPSAGSGPPAVAIAPGAHALEHRVLVANGHGFLELRVTSARFIFGGPGGGFED